MARISVLIAVALTLLGSHAFADCSLRKPLDLGELTVLNVKIYSKNAIVTGLNEDYSLLIGNPAHQGSNGSTRKVGLAAGNLFLWKTEYIDLVTTNVTSDVRGWNTFSGTVEDNEGATTYTARRKRKLNEDAGYYFAETVIKTSGRSVITGIELKSWIESSGNDGKIAITGLKSYCVKGFSEPPTITAN